MCPQVIWVQVPFCFLVCLLERILVLATAQAFTSSGVCTKLLVWLGVLVLIAASRLRGQTMAGGVLEFMQGGSQNDPRVLPEGLRGCPRVNPDILPRG